MIGENTKIIYSPRLWSKPLHEGKERWKVIVAHRRSGKTFASINHLIRDAVRVERSKYAYIAPTYKQAKNIAWDILKEYARKIDGVVFNESELRADFRNGSRITLYGADNPDSLRGLGLWGVVFDEYSQQPSKIFTEIIRPALADHEGYAIWIGTPKGKNDFHRLYQVARKTDNWLGLLLTVEDTKLINDAELLDSKAIMTNDEYNQEWYCSFEAAIKGAYYSQELSEMRSSGRIKQVPQDKELKVHTVWDLGVGDATSIGFYQVVNNEYRMIDYYGNTGKGLDFYINYLHTKPYIYGEHFAPHDIKVREFSSGKSRWEIGQNLGINFQITPNMKIDDGINVARLFLNKLWVDEKKCETFLDYIGQYKKEWNDLRGCFGDKPVHDFTSHAADMLRYTAIVHDKMTNYDYQQEPLDNEPLDPYSLIQQI